MADIDIEELLESALAMKKNESVSTYNKKQIKKKSIYFFRLYFNITSETLNHVHYNFYIKKTKFTTFVKNKICIQNFLVSTFYR
jgi:hypothetical protein